MATVTLYSSPPFLSPHAPFSPPMSPLLLRLRHRHRLLRRPLSVSVAAAAVAGTEAWTPAPVTLAAPASADASLFHVAVDLAAAPDVAAAHVSAGQYIQLRLPEHSNSRPVFLAIASPPAVAAARGEFEFLVKSVPGTTAELLCGLGRGDVVELSGVMGRGFEVERISPPHKASTVLIFATGSGISAIRSLIESGFNANKRSDVRLYYGARNVQRMAYQDRFKDWESTGVRILPVLSQPNDRWKGERGYVQTVFSRAKQILNPSSTGAVLCGHKQMTEDITSMLVADGVSKDKILKNF